MLLGYLFKSDAAQSGIYTVEDNYVYFNYEQYADKPEDAIYYFLYDLKYSGSEITSDNILATSLRECYNNMVLFKNDDVLTLAFVDEAVYWDEEKGGLTYDSTASGQFGNLDYYLDDDKIYIANTPPYTFGTFDGVGRGLTIVGSSYDIYGDTSNTIFEEETDLKTSYLYFPKFKIILDAFNVTIDSIINFISLGLIACGVFFLGWMGIRKLVILVVDAVKRGSINV